MPNEVSPPDDGNSNEDEVRPRRWRGLPLPAVSFGVQAGLTATLLGFTVLIRLRRADDERHHAAERLRRQHEAVEINDTLVQGLSAAKWSLESGDVEQALGIVSDTLDLGNRLVSELIRDTDLASAWTGTRTGSTRGGGARTGSTRTGGTRTGGTRTGGTRTARQATRAAG